MFKKRLINTVTVLHVSKLSFHVLYFFYRSEIDLGQELGIDTLQPTTSCALSKMDEIDTEFFPFVTREAKRYDVKECATCVVYRVNQKFKDLNLIDASSYLYLCILNMYSNIYNN